MGRLIRCASLNSSSVIESSSSLRFGHTGIWPYLRPITTMYGRRPAPSERRSHIEKFCRVILHRVVCEPLTFESFDQSCAVILQVGKGAWRSLRRGKGAENSCRSTLPSTIESSKRIYKAKCKKALSRPGHTTGHTSGAWTAGVIHGGLETGEDHLDPNDGRGEIRVGHRGCPEMETRSLRRACRLGPVGECSVTRLHRTFWSDIY